MTLTRCAKCVMPKTRPDTEWVDGVCTACIAHAARAEIDWVAREDALLRILESVKPNSDGYHCVVPSSGGKDSHWQVLKLIELGVRPLVVTASTCMLTSVGARNIRNLARYATTMEITPNLRVRSLLNRLGLELVGDISWPEHVSIFSTPWRIAHRMEIPLLFYGENPQNAYGGPVGTLEDSLMTESWITQFGGHLRMRADDLVGQHGLTWEDMADYMLPAPLDMAGLSVRFLGHYSPWDSHRNAKAAIDAGMEAPETPPCAGNWWRWENLDNQQTSIHDFQMYCKYGFGRFCSQISVDVRYGLISRDKAYALVRESDGMFPWTYLGQPFESILEQIGLTDGEFLAMVKGHTNHSLFSGEQDRRPILKEFAWGGD